MREFDVVIVEDEKSGYMAFVPALPGCHTQGETLGDLINNAKEAIELYVETLTEEASSETEGSRDTESEGVCLRSHPFKSLQTNQDPSEDRF